MTNTESDDRRRWILAPKGDVQFEKESRAVSMAALGCLGARVRGDVSFDIQPQVLGSNGNSPINVKLKIETGQWVAEDGTNFVVSDPNIKLLAEVALQKAQDRLNAALSSPLDVHLGLAAIYPDYGTPRVNDRSNKTPYLSSWRRADAAWIKNRISEPETIDAPRDTFDRAIELIEQLDRPVSMQWVYFGRHDGAHRIALRAEKQIGHPIIALKAIETKLLVDRATSLNSVAAQRHVLGTHIMALVQALRRYGGLSIGDIEIGAYVVRDFNQTEDGVHVLNLRVAPNAWGIPVGKASRMKVETLLNAAPSGLVFDAGSGPLRAPTDTPEDKVKQER
jgi:hypothetical protein